MVKSGHQSTNEEAFGMAYVFRPAKQGEIDAVFSLFEKRIQWMDREEIRQWNVTDYLAVYPKSYYQQQQAKGNLYVLTGDTIVRAVVLLQNDERWQDRSDSRAFYVHNLVTDPSVKGVGKRMLTEIENTARLHKKQYVRLDCAVDNDFLNQYYASAGYALAGQCQDGPYTGNRREKKL